MGVACNIMGNYLSTIKTRGFLYLETKKAAALCLQGFSIESIMEKALKENIFLLKTKNRRREIAATILERLDSLDRFLLKKIVNGNLETGKLIAFYAIMKTDRLFFEFMLEVFRRKLLLRDGTITPGDFSSFFHSKAEQDGQVASWADYTFYKLSQVYRKILLEAGLAKRNKKNIEINRVLIEPDLVQYLENSGGQDLLRVLRGEI